MRKINSSTKFARFPSGAPPEADTGVILWWFVTFFAATCYFKFRYIEFFYLGGGPAVFGYPWAGVFDPVVDIFPIFSRDILHAGLIVGAAYLVGRRLLRLSFNVLMLLATLLWLSLGAANLLAYKELRSHLTFDVLDIAVSWALSDLALIKFYLSKQAILLVLMILGWCAVPFFIVRAKSTRSDGSRLDRRFWTATAVACLAFVAAGALALSYPEAILTWWWAYALFVVAAAATAYSPRFAIPWTMLAIVVRRLTLAMAVVLLAASGSVQAFQLFQDQTKTPTVYEGHVPTILASLFGDEVVRHEDMAALKLEDLRDRYRALAYPGQDASPTPELVALPREGRQGRHVLIVSLETAFQRYYRLFDDPSLTNLHRMSRQALVSEFHNTTTPFTTWAASSILSGLYPVPLSSDVAESFKPDSLPIVLAGRGYESSYIDSFIVDWRAGTQKHAKMYRGLGIDRQLDSTSVPGFDHRNKNFEELVRLEEAAFDRALASILDAEGKGRGAFVYMQTALGHFPLRAPPGREDDDVAGKIRRIAGVFDRLLGSLLARLDEAGLSEKIILVVTGDHGLRYNSEFVEMGVRMAHSGIAFNVPLIIYAPGLIDRQVPMPYVTSHIDLAPTLLAMLGVPVDDLFHHGTDMLDGSTAKRVTFMFNTHLSPVEGYHWNGMYFTFDPVRGAARVAGDAAHTDDRSLAQAMAGGAPIPEPLADPDALIHAAHGVFDQTIAYFLQRGARASSDPQ